MRNEPTEVLPSTGTDGSAIVPPIWGTVKRRLLVGDATPRILGWIAILNLSAVLVAAALFTSDAPTPSWWKLAALAVLAGAAERQAVRVTKNVEMTVSFLPFVFTAVAFGPTAAFVVGGVSNLAVFGRPYLRWAVYTPARALSGWLTGWAATAAVVDQHAFSSILLAATAAGLVNIFVDTVVNATTLTLRRTAPARSFLGATGPFFALSLPLYIPVVALMVYGYRNYSFWMAATFLVPAIALQRLVHLYREQREATRALAEANRRLEHASVSFAAGLVATLDARDRYTAGHSAAVAVYARDIAKRLGLSTAQQDLAHLCGLVHDIGKVGLPAGLLEKPGSLTLDERRQMEEHSIIGERILENVEGYDEIAPIVRHHHERIDGEGYPDCLVADEIPLLARIIAVADAYDAMTSDRPYRDSMPSRVARLRVAQAVGSQFDTTVVAAFEAILAQASEEYRTGVSSEFVGASRALSAHDCAHTDGAALELNALQARAS